MAIHLDHAATTPLDPRVRDAMGPWLGERFGNPSSRHPLGVAALEAIDRARAAVARTLAVRPERVAFTSGATEANNLAVRGLAWAARKRGRHVLVGATEHACVRESAASLVELGFEVETMRLTPSGALDLDDAAKRMRADTVLVAQMLVSNEFGSRYPIEQLARIVRARAPAARLHVDAVQAFAQLDCAPSELGANTLALSAHKLHGPQGVGVLVHDGSPIAPQSFGGGQENGLRSGTENVAGIVGCAAAIEIAASERERARSAARAARDAIAAAIERIDGARVLEPGREHGRVDSIVCARIPCAPAEVVMHHLEARGVLASAGSACQSRKATLNPALLAIGLDERAAAQVLRFSFARTTTLDEARRAGEALVEVCRTLASVHS